MRPSPCRWRRSATAPSSRPTGSSITVTLRMTATTRRSVANSRNSKPPIPTKGSHPDTGSLDARILTLRAGQAFSAPTAVITGGGADRGDQVIPIEALDQDGLGAGGKRGGGKLAVGC